MNATQQIPREALQSPEAWYSFLDLSRSKLTAEGHKKAKERGLPLMDLAKTVAEMGGWLRVTRLNKWKHVDSLLGGEEGQAKTDYEALLLPIEKKSEIAEKYRDGNPFRVSYHILRFDCLQPVLVLYPPSGGKIDRDFWTTLRMQDVVILRGFAREVWGLDLALFATENLAPLSESPCTVRQQSPVTDSRHAQPPVQSKALLGDFLPTLEAPPDGTAYAATVDLAGWTAALVEMRKALPSCLLFDSDADVLGYARSEVASPHLCLRGKDFWTGAHQERLGLSLVSINAGPESVEIWALEGRYVQPMRREVREQLGFDLLEKEGEWWPDENYVLSRGFLTSIGEQQPGDILIAAPGALTWTRSRRAAQVEWHVGRKDVRQFRASLEREAVNRKLQLASDLPIFAVAIDFLNAELDRIPDELALFLYEQVEKRIRKEEAARKKLGVPLPDSVSPGEFCSMCRQETVWVFFRCESCDNRVICALCVPTHEHTTGLKCEKVYEKARLEALLKRVIRRSDAGGECFIPHLIPPTAKSLPLFYLQFRGSPDCVVFKGIDGAFPINEGQKAKFNGELKRSREEHAPNPALTKRRVVSTSDATLVINTTDFPEAATEPQGKTEVADTPSTSSPSPKEEKDAEKTENDPQKSAEQSEDKSEEGKDYVIPKRRGK